MSTFKLVEQDQVHHQETYQGKPDLTWWHSIIVKTEDYETWGSMCEWCEATNGWFLEDILDLTNTTNLSKIENPLVTVKMQIEHPLHETEETTFIGY